MFKMSPIRVHLPFKNKKTEPAVKGLVNFKIRGFIFLFVSVLLLTIKISQ